MLQVLNWRRIFDLMWHPKLWYFQFFIVSAGGWWSFYLCLLLHEINIIKNQLVLLFQVSSSGGFVPTWSDRRGIRGTSWDSSFSNPKVWHGLKKSSISEHCSIRRIHIVQRVRGSTPLWGEKAGAQGYKDKNKCSARTSLLDLDRRIYPGFPRYLQENVGFKERVWRGRPKSNPPENLLILILKLNPILQSPFDSVHLI